MFENRLRVSKSQANEGIRNYVSFICNQRALTWLAGEERAKIEKSGKMLCLLRDKF